MDTISIIIGIVLVIAYIAVAIYAIKSCTTTGGTICCTGAAIGVGALLAAFIEYIIAICIIGLGVCILGTIFD